MQKNNFRLPAKIAAALALALIPAFASAAVIYQSASAGPADCSVFGSIVDSGQFLGARFSLGSTTTLTGVGGQVCGSSAADDFFAAILPLSGPGALPAFNPLDLIGNALASATFVPGDSGADVTIPFSITLGPGDYALVFGGGLLGTTGFGWMPDSGTDLPGASYLTATGDIAGGTGNWSDGGFANTRFFVTAETSTNNPVPEPATALLLSLGLGIGAWVRRSRKA